MVIIIAFQIVMAHMFKYLHRYLYCSNGQINEDAFNRLEMDEENPIVYETNANNEERKELLKLILNT